MIIQCQMGNTGGKLNPSKEEQKHIEVAFYEDAIAEIRKEEEYYRDNIHVPSLYNTVIALKPEYTGGYLPDVMDFFKFVSKNTRKHHIAVYPYIHFVIAPQISS